MKLFGNAKVVRGSIAWTNPLRLSITLVHRPSALAETAASGEPAAEYDEEGRRYVFRFARTAPQKCTIERDRIFDYLKRHRLPDESDRQLRRDLRNQADLFADIRELQTHPDIAGA
jgi:hypothetical protein